MQTQGSENKLLELGVKSVERLLEILEEQLSINVSSFREKFKTLVALTGEQHVAKVVTQLSEITEALSKEQNAKARLWLQAFGAFLNGALEAAQPKDMPSRPTVVKLPPLPDSTETPETPEPPETSLLFMELAKTVSKQAFWNGFFLGSFLHWMLFFLACGLYLAFF